MKNKLSILLFILLNLLNMGALSDFKYNKDNFELAEIYMKDKSEFIKNGIKFQYKVNNNINDEALKVKKYITKNMTENYTSIGENEFKSFNKDFNINIKLWNKSNYTYVEIILLNSNNKYTSLDLKRMLKGLDTNTVYLEKQYFSYYKGKLSSCNKEIKEELIKKSGIEKETILEISNGYAGVGSLRDDEKVNFAFTNYDTGSYVIIGTPIIFETY